MISFLTKIFFNKDVILYNRHRNSLPLLNEVNRKKYFFINYLPFWKLTAIVGRKSRLRYRVMGMVLSVIRPVYIIDINWIAKLNRLCFVWCRNHRPSQFVVIQHGLYIGGMITDNAHKYAKCDVILCWGNHSLKEFQRYNSNKQVKIVLWGNALYNQYDRAKIAYSDTTGNKVLVAPTVVKGKRKQMVEDFMGKLKNLGFEVYVKEHNYQAKLSESFEGYPKIQGDLYEHLRRQEFDIIISDTSTCLVDALYFKNNALFFSPEGVLPEYTQNAYSAYLQNISTIYKSFTTKEDVLACIDIDAQENLLADMVTFGDNDLSGL